MATRVQYIQINSTTDQGHPKFIIFTHIWGKATLLHISEWVSWQSVTCPKDIWTFVQCIAMVIIYMVDIRVHEALRSNIECRIMSLLNFSIRQWLTLHLIVHLDDTILYNLKWSPTSYDLHLYLHLLLVTRLFVDMDNGMTSAPYK